MPKPYDNYIEYINHTIVIPDNQPYVAIDLFAGCGGLSLGFEAAGIKTIGYEMVGDFCETYRRNLHTECYNKKISVNTEYPKVRILIGGPPCQPFSRRGKQKGQSDERNGFPAFIEAVKQINPDIWICENVKGLPELNTDYFQSIIDQLKKLGYIVEYRTFQLVKFDVPQNRERMVIVGHHGGFNFPEPADYKITAGEALGALAAEIPENANFLTAAMDSYIAKYEAASKCKTPRDLHLDQPARTLTCRNLAGATSDMQRIKLPDGRRRRITPREAARLQGFPDWFVFYGSEESQFTQIGNAVPPTFAYKMALAVVDYLEGRHKQGMDRYNLPELSTRKQKGKKAFQEKSPEVQKLIREHNIIQQQIITEFLPRHGHGAMLLYCGDADNKYGIIYEKEKLESLGIKDIAQNKLPDIIAYSEKEDWIFLIEAYHTSNPITPERKYELEIMLGDAARKCCFVTAFENQAAYRSCPEDLAWETEVWVATQPDHMIHLNGSRFQGPYERSNKVL